MIEKLQGFKTHGMVALTLAWVVVYLKIPGAKEAIGSDNFQMVLAGLIAAAGIFAKVGVQRAENAANEAADVIREKL